MDSRTIPKNILTVPTYLILKCHNAVREEMEPSRNNLMSDLYERFKTMVNDLRRYPELEWHIEEIRGALKAHPTGKPVYFIDNIPLGRYNKIGYRVPIISTYYSNYQGMDLENKEHTPMGVKPGINIFDTMGIDIDLFGYKATTSLNMSVDKPISKSQKPLFAGPLCIKKRKDDFSVDVGKPSFCVSEETECMLTSGKSNLLERVASSLKKAYGDKIFRE